MATFGEALKAAREAAKLTQQQLAAKAGLSQAAISKAELAATAEDAGRRDTLDRVAAALGVSVAYLQGAQDKDVSAGRRATIADADRDAAIEADLTRAVAAPRFDVPAVAARAQLQSALTTRPEGFVEIATRRRSHHEQTEYLNEIIGRAFDPRVHNIRDARVIAEILDPPYQGEGFLGVSLPAHSVSEIEAGSKFILDAVAALRRASLPATERNLIMAMVVASGRALLIARGEEGKTLDGRVRAHRSRVDANAVVDDPPPDDGDIPF